MYMAPFMVGDWGWGRSLPGQDPEGHPPSHTAAPAVRAARECVLGKIEISSSQGSNSGAHRESYSTHTYAFQTFMTK